MQRLSLNSLRLQQRGRDVQQVPHTPSVACSAIIASIVAVL
jgi:hypothetical protein